MFEEIILKLLLEPIKIRHLLKGQLTNPNIRVSTPNIRGTSPNIRNTNPNIRDRCFKKNSIKINIFLIMHENKTNHISKGIQETFVRNFFLCF